MYSQICHPKNSPVRPQNDQSCIPGMIQRHPARHQERESPQREQQVADVDIGGAQRGDGRAGGGDLVAVEEQGAGEGGEEFRQQEQGREGLAGDDALNKEEDEGRWVGYEENPAEDEGRGVREGCRVGVGWHICDS